MQYQNRDLSAAEVMDSYLADGPESPTRSEAMKRVRHGQRKSLQGAFEALDQIMEIAAASGDAASGDAMPENAALESVAPARIERARGQLEVIRRRAWLEEATARWEQRQAQGVAAIPPIEALGHALGLAPSARTLARKSPAGTTFAVQSAFDIKTEAQRISVEAQRISDGRSALNMNVSTHLQYFKHEIEALSEIETLSTREIEARVQGFSRHIESIASHTRMLARQEEALIEQQAVLNQAVFDQQQQEEAIQQQKERLAMDPDWQQARMEAARAALRTLFGPDGPPPQKDLAEVAADLGVFVRVVPLDGFEGCIVTDGSVGGILVNADMPDARRRRFTLAHEIGHYLMHRAEGGFQDTTEELDDFQSPLELEANLFASLMLIPDTQLPPSEDRPTLAIAGQLMEVCDVPLLAAVRRQIRHTELASALVVLKDGQVRYFVPSLRFRTQGGSIATKTPPHPETPAARVLDTANDAEATGEVPAGWWVQSGPLAAPGQVLREESRRLDNGYVYVLLALQDEATRSE